MNDAFLYPSYLPISTEPAEEEDRPYKRCRKVVLFWRKGQFFSKAIEKVDYNWSGAVNTLQAGWTNLVTNIARHAQEGHVYEVKRGESGFKLLMRPEPKNTAWMKNILQKTTIAVNLILHAFVGSYSIDKVCMILPSHRRFIRCKADPSFVTEAMRQLTLLYAQLELSKRSDIDGEEDVRSSAELYVRTVRAIEARKLLDV